MAPLKKQGVAYFRKQLHIKKGKNGNPSWCHQRILRVIPAWLGPDPLIASSWDERHVTSTSSRISLVLSSLEDDSFSNFTVIGVS